jgi:hypothetical protein
MTAGRTLVAILNVLVMAIAFGSVALLGAAQRRSLARERALSRTDGLTGLLNVRGFHEEAAAAIARAIRYRHAVTLAYVDLDAFKDVNDHLGHDRGDAVLVEVARALRRVCRSTTSSAAWGATSSSSCSRRRAARRRRPPSSRSARRSRRRRYGPARGRPPASAPCPAQRPRPTWIAWCVTPTRRCTR